MDENDTESGEYTSLKDALASKGITLIGHASPTSILTFISCPKEYFFGRVMRVEPKRKFIDYMGIGNCFHNVMYYFYGCDMYGVIQIPPGATKLEEITDVFAERMMTILSGIWDPVWDTYSLPQRPMMERSLHSMAELEAQRYIDLRKLGLANKIFAPIKREVPLEFIVRHGKYAVVVHGKADCVFITPKGEIEVLDYKYSKHTDKYTTLQGITYAMGVMAKFNQRPTRTIFLYTKSPVIDTPEREQPVDVTEQKMESAQRLYVETKLNIMKGDFPKKGKERENKCHYCDYKTYCDCDGICFNRL